MRQYHINNGGVFTAFIVKVIYKLYFDTRHFIVCEAQEN